MSYYEDFNLPMVEDDAIRAQGDLIHREEYRYVKRLRLRYSQELPDLWEFEARYASDIMRKRSESLEAMRDSAEALNTVALALDLLERQGWADAQGYVWHEDAPLYTEFRLWSPGDRTLDSLEADQFKGTDYWRRLVFEEENPLLAEAVEARLGMVSEGSREESRAMVNYCYTLLKRQKWADEQKQLLPFS